MSAGIIIVLRCMHSFTSDIHEINLATDSVVHFQIDYKIRSVIVRQESHRLAIPNLIGRIYVQSQLPHLLLEPLIPGVEVERDGSRSVIDFKHPLSLEDTIAFDEYEFRAHVTPEQLKMPPALPSETSTSIHEDYDGDDAGAGSYEGHFRRTTSETALIGHVEITADVSDSETETKDEDEYDPDDSASVRMSSTSRPTDLSLSKATYSPETSPTTRIKSQSQGGETQAAANILYSAVKNNNVDASSPLHGPPEAKITTTYKGRENKKQRTVGSESPTVADSEGSDDDAVTLPPEGKGVQPSSSNGKLRMPSKRKGRGDAIQQPSKKRAKATPIRAETDDSDEDSDESVMKRKPQHSTITKSSPVPSQSPFLTGPKLKVLMSSCTLDSKISNWLKRNAQIIEEVPGSKTRWICVVPKKKVPTTPKVLKTLLSGKLVVSETWVYKSKEAGALLDPQDFVHPAVQGTLGDDRRHKLYKGMTLFFTQDAQKRYGKAWEDTLAIAKETGSARIEYGSVSKGNDLTPKEKVIFFADGAGDDAAALFEHGRTVYDTHLLSQSILHGAVDLEDTEFQLTAQSKEAAKSTKKG